MRYILSLLCVFLIACGSQETNSQQQTKEEIHIDGEAFLLENKSFFDGKLQMLFPTVFEQMDNDLLLAKYDKNNLPTFVYTNDDNSINCVINFTENPSSLDKLTEYESIFARRLNNNGVTFYKSQIEQINERDFLVLEFDSPSNQISIYNYMAVGVLDDRLFMATFNCLLSEKDNWKSVGNQIINSIEFPKEH